ncbi:PEP-CTERM sorting domain-containing protein [Massilia sp.]|uniref:PEP-CTERM sorting domain-containing protein n=1 Tax=Massilia sp. TaxID=1882437 RepID=UPI0028AA2CBB|nr:PEP-CTERM sorting domain-containing protein [Massilia sp.]
MTITKSILAFAAAMTLAASSQAAVLLTSELSAGNTITDYSRAGSVSFDLDLEKLGTSRFSFAIEEEDLLGPLSLNAIVRNLSGTALNQFVFRLSGIGFASHGSVTPTFGTLGQVTQTPDYAHIGFGKPEWAEFHFGNPLLVDGAGDWFLDTRGLNVGDRFAIVATVPEPSSLALVLPLLGMAGVMARRRRG